MELQLISKKLENIENELHSLKIIVLAKSKKGVTSLKSMLKGIHVDEKEIMEAEKSVFHPS